MGRLETGERLNEQVNGYLTELQTQLSQGHSESYLASLAWYARFHRYSWANAWLIVSQCPHATHVAGYKKWLELGFQVRKGEKGIAIRAPWLRKEPDPETGEVKERLIGWLGVKVFDISQTEEYPDKQPPPLEQEVPGDFESLYAHLWQKVVANGTELREKPLPHGHDGFCVGRAITINSRLSPYLKVTTLIHEYLHAIAHSDDEAWKKWTKAEMEWQAESVSFTVCRAIGVENVNAKDYLLRYRLTTERLAEMMKLIQSQTKQVLSELDLLQPLNRQREADPARMEAQVA